MKMFLKLTVNNTRIFLLFMKLKTLTKNKINKMYIVYV